MADRTYSEHISILSDWLRNTANEMYATPDKRSWCILGLDSDFKPESLEEYFSTEEINKTFQEEAKKSEVTNVPVAQLQMENDHIFALSRMMLYRHQPRLKYYRDDLENKDIRTASSIAISLAKMDFVKEIMKGQ